MRIGGKMQIAEEHQRDAAVTQGDGNDMVAADRRLEEKRRHQHDDGRLQKQNQAFETGRDILQTEKIQIARQVITDEAECCERAPVALRQTAAAGEHRHQDEKRQRKQQAQRQYCFGINCKFRVQNLDQDCLEGKAGRRDQHHRGTEQTVRSGFAHAVSVDGCRRGCCPARRARFRGRPASRWCAPRFSPRRR